MGRGALRAAIAFGIGVRIEFEEDVFETDEGGIGILQEGRGGVHPQLFGERDGDADAVVEAQLQGHRRVTGVAEDLPTL